MKLKEIHSSIPKSKIKPPTHRDRKAGVSKPAPGPNPYDVGRKDDRKFVTDRAPVANPNLGK